MKPKHNHLASCLFILAFFCILLYPLFGTVFDRFFTLSGVTTEAVLEAPSTDGLMSGKYQTSLNNWVENNFPGRTSLIKLRSQLHYSLLDQSPNANVLVGKDHYLFSHGYIYSELGIIITPKEAIAENVAKMEQLQQLLNDAGKELYLFITPNKASFCKDKIPDYFFSAASNEPNDYTTLIGLLEDSQLHYLDARSFIEGYDGPAISAPVFYPTGIHWSSPYAASAAKALTELISQTGKWDLPTLELTEQPSAIPVWPDADLYQSMNLLLSPRGIEYYNASLSIVEEGDHPNVFMRGGSFLGQSMNTVVHAGVFNKEVHFENNYYFTDRYTQQHTLASRRDYDDFENLQQYLQQTDIMILEINEAAIAEMSFGFIDYLLEHPEWLKYPEN